MLFYLVLLTVANQDMHQIAGFGTVMVFHELRICLIFLVVYTKERYEKALQHYFFITGAL